MKRTPDLSFFSETNTKKTKVALRIDENSTENDLCILFMEYFKENNITFCSLILEKYVEKFSKDNLHRKPIKYGETVYPYSLLELYAFLLISKNEQQLLKEMSSQYKITTVFFVHLASTFCDTKQHHVLINLILLVPEVIFRRGKEIISSLLDVYEEADSFLKNRIKSIFKDKNIYQQNYFDILCLAIIEKNNMELINILFPRINLNELSKFMSAYLIRDERIFYYNLFKKEFIIAMKCLNEKIATVGFLTKEELNFINHIRLLALEAIALKNIDFLSFLKRSDFNFNFFRSMPGEQLTNLLTYKENEYHISTLLARTSFYSSPNRQLNFGTIANLEISPCILVFLTNCKTIKDLLLPVLDIDYASPTTLTTALSFMNKNHLYVQVKELIDKGAKDESTANNSNNNNNNADNNNANNNNNTTPHRSGALSLILNDAEERSGALSFILN